MIFIPKVSNGQRVLSETCDNDLIFRKPEDRLPTCIQVRMIGKMGLFKGLLIVTNDKSLCPAGTIKFRESMRKSQPTTDYIDRTGSTHDNYLLIKNTFEGKQPRFARTSDRLILMLTQCGVPLAYFEQMMQKEVERVLVAPSSKKGVLTLLQSFLGRQKDGIVSSSAASIAVSGVLIPDDPRDEYDEIEYDDNDETTIEDWDDEDDSRSVITGYFNNVNKNVEVRNGRSVNQKRAEAALSFLLTDHELDEGQFLSHIRYLQTQQ